MLKDSFYSSFYRSSITPRSLDRLLENGWRHFGEYFYSYNYSNYKNRVCKVIPVRIRLENFSLSKSQRRILKKNRDLETVIRPIELTPETIEIFEAHRWRFEDSIPDSIYTFLSYEPAKIPCEALEVGVYKDKKLIAKSFFDVGEKSVSTAYAIFAPEESKRCLGIFTMLLEIDYAIKTGKTFYYHGYVYEVESFYDYKKRFRGLEKFDWKGNWEKF